MFISHMTHVIPSITQVEADLNKSKQVREKQGKEFNRQMEEEKAAHNREVGCSLIQIYIWTTVYEQGILVISWKAS